MHGIREVLRALAEVRDGVFYPLWVELSLRIRNPLPEIGFRIYQVADSQEAIVAVWVGAMRSDGKGLGWGVTVQTAGAELVVTGEVSVDDDHGSHEIFSLSDRSADPEQAAELIQRFAREVCARLECLETPDVLDDDRN